MIRLILAGIALLACGYAVYTDFRYRYIDNWLTWGLVGVGLTGHALISVLERSYWPVLFSLCAAAVFFTLASVLFYAGAFGGGDTKLLTGLAATVPIYPALLNNYVSPSLMAWPFLVMLLVNLLFIGAKYSIVYLLVRAFMRYKTFKKGFKRNMVNMRKLFYACLALLVVLLVSCLLDGNVFIAGAMLIGLFIFVLLLYAFTKSVEDIMVYKALPSKLEAGDRPVRAIRVSGKLVYKPGRIGLTEEDVRRLQALEEMGKLGAVKVRDGVPYAPAIFLALAFSLFFGDLFLVFLRIYT